MTALDDPKIWTEKVLDLTSGTLLRRAVALLSGLQVSGPAITIGPISIRDALDPIDKPLEKYQLTSVKVAVLEVKYLEHEPDVSIRTLPELLLERSFVAIQVAVDSWVGMSQFHHFTETGSEVAVGGSRRYGLADSWHPTDEPSLAEDHNFPDRFLRAYQAQSGELGLALRRFSRACCELMEESIVDFVIVLDALLGYRLQEEISHRVAARGAILLAPDPGERSSCYHVLRYLYQARSRLVHGEREALPEPDSKMEKALVAFGVRLDDGPGTFRYYVADLARKLTRQTLLGFLEGRATLDRDWLLQLELGLV